ADGYKVVVAEDVADALRKLESERPAAVIADLNGASLALVDKVRTADTLTGRLDPETPLMILPRRFSCWLFGRLLREIVPGGGRDLVACAGRAPRSGGGLASAGIAQ
ncbi:MAG: hypothetical protein QOG56_2980, partial [Solirubrobacteraceae bacterium]|nr:hypothetical protein [Solirubrobacteraceae bacterium]